MLYAIPNHATHVALVVIEFSDGGEPEETPVHFGTFDECDSIVGNLPATSYNGERHARAAFACVYPLNPFCMSCLQRHDGVCTADAAREGKGGT